MEDTSNKFILVNKIPALHLAANNDELRPAQGFIRFLNGYAACTNGHLIVIAKTSDIFPESFAEQLEGCFIHASGYKYLYDRAKKGMCCGEITDEGIVINIDEDHTHVVHLFTEHTLAARYNQTKKNFPNWESLWNNAAKKAADESLFEYWIQINPTFIATIHSIFGSPNDGMKIRPTGEGNPILISSMTMTWNTMYAIVMPMAKTQTEFQFTEVPNSIPQL